MEDKLATVAPVTAMIASVHGVQVLETQRDLGQLLGSQRLFWIDIAGGNAQARTDMLRQLGLDEADIDWAQRFGQKGRITIGRDKSRAVTWLSQLATELSEIHLFGTRNFILTVWDGDAAILDGARIHFAERAEQLEATPFRAMAIVLQLLLTTLHRAVGDLDAQLQTIHLQLENDPTAIDFKMLTNRIQRVHATWSDIDRYSSAVRSATVGIEALPGVDARGAAELNDYADQVEDVEHRLHERYQWAADIVQHYTTALAQHQGEQISRLTIVSMIFLPLSFLTGFFGMNFNWMADRIGGPIAFVLLGVALPVSCVIATLAWFKRRGLI
jgi:Mg2+ and Co2+ transporter CorA